LNEYVALKDAPANVAWLVSVVIPCYTRAHFLAEAIGSVPDQTHRSLEVVVDDGSADETPKVTLRATATCASCVRTIGTSPPKRR
jgi:hypothetical protein